MTRRILPAILVFGFSLYAQLSPGKLARAHGHLEGLGNCATCHTLGSKLFKDKCLACHEALSGRIRSGKGLHAGKDYERCQSCHSDHQGLEFSLIHWPKGQEAFEHEATGFKLEGKHAALKCLECHQERFLTDKSLLKPERKSAGQTFLGLSRDCLDCHLDFHKQKLSRECLSCHDMKGWKPAPAFDHDKSAYALKGAHARLECGKCHPAEPAAGEGKPGMRFKPIEHERCQDCHEDPHRGTAVGRCQDCHDLETFKPARGFDHSRTRFPLTGKHARVSCEPCHPKASGALVFAKPGKGPLPECKTCHKDPHENRLGSNCGTCHGTEGWGRDRNKKFDHGRTRFPLLGVHERVDCRKCHENGLKVPAFGACVDCHLDIHQGQFKKYEPLGACKACHDEMGWKPSHFGVKRHGETRFPLRDAHLATPCFACHESPARGKAVRYLIEGTSCGSCHPDIHKGEADAHMRAKGDCGACHTSSTWRQLSFDHEKTGFSLEGAHERASCGACHKEKAGRPQLAGVGKACSDCHEDRHAGEFANREGETACGSCHTPLNWRAEKFDHQRSRFPLDGAHVAVACKNCHKPAAGADRISYKPLDPTCQACH